MDSPPYPRLLGALANLSTMSDVITTLPTEILLEIFERLKKADLSSVSQVCRRWNAIALPVLYHTFDAGDYSQNTMEQQALVYNFTALAAGNPKIRALIQHMRFKTSSLILPTALSPLVFPNLCTVTALSIDRNCDMDSYARILYATPMQGLKKAHFGLRCEAAEAVFPRLFLESIMRLGPLVLEELRYSRLRTRTEAAAIGGYRDEAVVIDDRFCGVPIELEYTHMRSHYQLFTENYVYYLSHLTNLKVLDLDIGVSPDSFVHLPPLRSIHTTITNYLSPAPTPTQPNPDSRSAYHPTTHSKLLRLSHPQFIEIARDIADEITRQSSRSTPHAPLPSLQPVPSYHPRRNQARAKLSTLPASRFRDLVADVHAELLRSFPRLSDPAAGPTAPFPPPEGGGGIGGGRYDDFKSMGRALFAERLKGLQTARGQAGRDVRLMAYLRDVQVYVAPLIYERVEEAGMRSVEVVRVRLFMDGPWVEVVIQRAGERVEVFSVFPEAVVEEGGTGSEGKTGVYALYKEGCRVRVGVGVLNFVEGKWGLKGD